MRASCNGREKVDKTAVALLTLVLLVLGLMSGLMDHGVKQTVKEVVQTTGNVSTYVPTPEPWLATSASADNSHEVPWVSISIRIHKTADGVA